MSEKPKRRTTTWPHADLDDIASIVRAASDVSVVVDESNVVTSVVHNLDLPTSGVIEDWKGRNVEEIVSDGSRSTLRRMLRLVRDDGPAARFDVTHPLGNRGELPVRYAGVRLAYQSHVALLGRDRRAEVELHQKLLAGRQAANRSDSLLRQSDAQYRMLFESASDPTIIADATTGKIREVNAAAARLLGRATAALAGKRIASVVARADQPKVQAMISAAAAAAGPQSETLETLDGASIEVAAQLFRAGDLKLLMLRLAPAGQSAVEGSGASPQLALLQQAPEAIMICDEGGGVAWANEAFLALAEVPLAAHLLGRPLDQLFEWQGAGREAIFQNVRLQGSIAGLAAMLRGAHGNVIGVEMSVIALQAPEAGFGFVVRSAARDTGRRGIAGEVGQTAEGMIELVGRVPLKDLVRDTTDIIEKMCIEAALRLTGNNRASAARALGLSRQAFYLKLARFGIDGD